jgi:hypothetical protein
MRRLTTILVIAVGLSMCSGFMTLYSKGEAVEIPFVFEHNEILVQVKIGGHGPFTMMLDTDTDPSSIDLSFAKSNDFKLHAIHGEVTGGGSEHPTVYLTKLATVELGPLPARDLQAVAIDLGKMQNRLGKEIQGVLGDNFLAGRVLQIDYPRSVLRFSRSSFASTITKNSQTVFPFRYDDDGGIVMEGVVINGKKTKATIDTGSDGMFALTPAAVEYLGLTKAAINGNAETSIGYKGTVQNTQGRVDLIAIGPIEVTSPEVVFWGKGAGRDRRPWELDIGNAFLKDYIVTIDYLKKRIALEKP